MTSSANPTDSGSADSGGSLRQRAIRVAISIVVLVPVTVFLGYGGWIVLTLTAKFGLYDPKTDEGEPLRHRLAAWPDRNRDVMRTDGKEPLPLKP